MRSKRSTAKQRSDVTSRRTVQPRSTQWRRSLSSPLDTDRLGRAIGSVLTGGESLALLGALGAGKTALVRGIAAGLGAPAAAVSSPTFVLVHQYPGRLPLAHFDLYRLNSEQEAESIGLSDYFSGATVVAIEWADKAPGILPDDRLEMELRHRTVQSRSIRFRAMGPLSTALLARIKHHCASLVRKNQRSNRRRWRTLKGKASS